MDKPRRGSSGDLSLVHKPPLACTGKLECPLSLTLVSMILRCVNGLCNIALRRSDYNTKSDLFGD